MKKEAGARWCSGMTESNPGGRCRTQLRGWAGLHSGGGEGLGAGCQWPRGTGPQRLLGGWPGNRPCGWRGAGLCKALLLASSDQDRLKKETWGIRRKLVCFFLLECFPTPRRLLNLKVLGAWASARVVL